MTVTAADGPACPGVSRLLKYSASTEEGSEGRGPGAPAPGRTPQRGSWSRQGVGSAGRERGRQGGPSSAPGLWRGGPSSPSSVRPVRPEPLHPVGGPDCAGRGAAPSALPHRTAASGGRGRDRDGPRDPSHTTLCQAGCRRSDGEVLGEEKRLISKTIRCQIKSRFL